MSPPGNYCGASLQITGTGTARQVRNIPLTTGTGRRQANGTSHPVGVKLQTAASIRFNMDDFGTAESAALAEHSPDSAGGFPPALLLSTRYFSTIRLNESIGVLLKNIRAGPRQVPQTKTVLAIQHNVHLRTTLPHSGKQDTG